MDFEKLYKETFSQVHTSVSVKKEDYLKVKHTNIGRKIILIAAAVCTLALLCAGAYAANFFGLKDAVINRDVRSDTGDSVSTDSGEAENDSATEEPVIPTVETRDALSLQGYNDTPESQAVLEWTTYYESCDLSGLTNEPTEFDEEYSCYPVYNQEMADKLEEILAKYGLKKHTRMEILSHDELVEAVGGEFLSDGHAKYYGYIYEDGHFAVDGDYAAENGNIGYQLRRSVKGTFTDVTLYIGDADEYDEWQYNVGDYTLTLALSTNKALIITDLGDAFVTVNVLDGSEEVLLDSDTTITKEILESFADSFNWQVLANVITPNLDAIVSE